MTAQSFLNALTRFIARRGKPEKMLSDNGSQFVLSKEILKQKQDQFKLQSKLWPEDDDIQHYLLGQGINWNLIPQLSPWAGGLYERLVALVKDAFQRVLGRKILPLDDLQAFLAQLEAALNQRPITHTSDQPDGPLALRPVDFLLPGSMVALEPDDEDDEPGCLGRRNFHRRLCKKITTYFGEVWARWKENYLLLVRDRGGWHHDGPRSQQHRPTQLRGDQLPHLGLSCSGPLETRDSPRQ